MSTEVSGTQAPLNLPDEPESNKKALKKNHKAILFNGCVSTAALILFIIVLLSKSVTAPVRVSNNLGWVLYYSLECPHCQKVKQDNWYIWHMMNKVDINAVGVDVPPAINGLGVPIWYNPYTGQTWDGRGVFRK